MLAPLSSVSRGVENYLWPRSSSLQQFNDLRPACGHAMLQLTLVYVKQDPHTRQRGTWTKPVGPLVGSLTDDQRISIPELEACARSVRELLFNSSTKVVQPDTSSRTSRPRHAQVTLK